MTTVKCGLIESCLLADRYLRSPMAYAMWLFSDPYSRFDWAFTDEPFKFSTLLQCVEEDVGCYSYYYSMGILQCSLDTYLSRVASRDDTFNSLRRHTIDADISPLELYNTRFEEFRFVELRELSECLEAYYHFRKEYGPELCIIGGGIDLAQVLPRLDGDEDALEIFASLLPEWIEEGYYPLDLVATAKALAGGE